MERQIACSSGDRLAIEVVGRLRDRARDAAGCLVAGDGSTAPSRRSQVSTSACDRRGSAAGAPRASRRTSSVSPDSAAGRPGRGPLDRRCAQVVLRHADPRRSTPSAISRARAGSAAQRSRKSERTVEQQRIRRRERTTPAPRRCLELRVAQPELKSSSNWSTTTTCRSPDRPRWTPMARRHLRAGYRPADQRLQARGTNPARASEDFPILMRRSGEEPRTGNALQDRLDLGIPPEELVGIVRAVGAQAAVRAVVADPRVVPGRERQRGVLAEDRGLEAARRSPGSIPRSSPSVRRAERSVASASACRPDW